MLLISKENWPFTAGTHLTAEAAYAGLADHAEQLWLSGMLVAQEAYTCFIINAHKAWMRCRKRSTSVTHFSPLRGRAVGPHSQPFTFPVTISVPVPVPMHWDTCLG